MSTADPVVMPLSQQNSRAPSFAVLSLNPAVDRVIYLHSALASGGLNRAIATRLDPGSKGLNVATLLSRLGCDVEYYSFSGGIYGAFCEERISGEMIRSYFVRTSCGLRENVKIIDGDDVCTELNTRGGPYSEAECESLISALAGTRAGVVCLCGSIPQGVEKGVYNSLIAKLREKGKICVLDCDGEAMKLGIEAFPDIIKPNLREAEELFISSGLEICSDYRVIPVENPWEKYGKTRRKVPEAAEKAAAMCGEISEFFSVRVLCTLGGDGAICAEPGNKDVLFCPAPHVAMRGFAGAGDSFLAAYLSSFFSESYKNDGARALVRAVAAGSAKVTIDGSGIPDAEAVDKMMSGTTS